MPRIVHPRHLDATVDGLTVHYREAGTPAQTGIVLLHGSPASSHSFREVLPLLGEGHYVVAPDLIGYGHSDAPDPATFDYTFERLADIVEGLLQQLGLERYVVYVTDFGTAVGYHLATRHPDRIAGIVLQNGSVHDAGMGEAWEPARAYWKDPNQRSRSAVGDWFDFAGTRKDYVAGLPDRVLALLPRDSWHLDWERLARPGRIDIHERLFLDYGRHVARFPKIAEYHRRHQPPCLLVWGRHDTAFDVREVMAFLDVLDTVEAHILDGGHFLLETHAREVATAIDTFVWGIHDRAPTRR